MMVMMLMVMAMIAKQTTNMSIAKPTRRIQVLNPSMHNIQAYIYEGVVHVYVYAFVYVHVYVYVCVCMFVSMYVYVYVDVCASVSVSVCVRICICTCIGQKMYTYRLRQAQERVITLSSHCTDFSLAPRTRLSGTECCMGDSPGERSRSARQPTAPWPWCMQWQLFLLKRGELEAVPSTNVLQLTSRTHRR